VHLIVNAAADLPIYRQIMRQIEEAIAGGRLAPGEKLRSHRELSDELVVAPLTVKKAYDELEALGYIETQRGRGTFVCAKLPKPDRAEQRQRLAVAARSLMSQAYLAGLGLPDALDLVREADAELRGNKEK
jgi:GntR family transcriptional regulator